MYIIPVCVCLTLLYPLRHYIPVINYFHCQRITELLKSTDDGAKTIFGGYSSQRMKVEHVQIAWVSEVYKEIKNAVIENPVFLITM